MRSLGVFTIGTFFLALVSLGVKPTSGIEGKLELQNFQRSHNDSISDLIFLLDSSGSLWYYDPVSHKSKIGFDDEKAFVNSLLSFIRISMPATRVSVAVFGTDATLDINYVSSPNVQNHKCNFKKSFGGLKFRSGLTNMHDAFQYAYDIIFGTLSGSKRPNKLAKTAVFVLTDGMWNRGGDPYPIAKQLKDEDIEIFSIGVTNGVNMGVMRKLATDNSHAFHYNDFTQFRELANYLRGGESRYAVDHLVLTNIRDNVGRFRESRLILVIKAHSFSHSIPQHMNSIFGHLVFMLSADQLYRY